MVNCSFLYPFPSSKVDMFGNNSLREHNFPFLFRSILWIHRFGIQFSLPCMVVFMEHLADLER